MKVQIVDISAFNSIDPRIAERYLLANGWKEQHRLDSGVSIWFADHFEDKSYRLWLPFRADLPDYDQIMGRAVKQLAEAEDKSELQIFEDFNTVGIGDVIRLIDYDRLNRKSSTLPLTEGEELIQKGKDLAIAAAMAEKQPREVHPSSRPLDVRIFADNLRLAQSEPGSYIVKIVSPIALEDLEVAKEHEAQLDLIEMPATPFSRKAVERLVKSLVVLRDIGEEAERKGMYFFDPYRENIADGISANLCEAVISKSDNAPDKPLRVSVTWSSILPKPEDIRPAIEIDIPASYMSYYRVAAEEFRKKNPEPRSIQGYVKVLNKAWKASDGTISVITTINGVQAVVRVELSGADYSMAVRAHDEELYVVIEGELIKRGRFRWLKDPQNVHIIESPKLPF